MCSGVYVLHQTDQSKEEELKHDSDILLDNLRERISTLIVNIEFLGLIPAISPPTPGRLCGTGDTLGLMATRRWLVARYLSLSFIRTNTVLRPLYPRPKRSINAYIEQMMVL